MASREMSDWIKFFTSAGIPPGPALSYATIFVDNRIHINMLMELSKEYLKDMGVTVMGDIIAILKYAKTAHAEFEREKPPLNTSLMKPDEKVELKRHRNAGNRMLEHYMRKGAVIEGDVSPMVTVSPAMAVRLGAVPTTGKRTSATPHMSAKVVPVKRARRVDPSEEGHYVISMPKGSTPRTKQLLLQQKKTSAKSNVFDRLGKGVTDESTPRKGATVTHSVFGRLGGVQSQDEMSLSDSSDVSTLGYKGVLKGGRGGATQPRSEKTLTVKIPSVFQDKLKSLQKHEITTTSPASTKGILHGTESVRSRLGKRRNALAVAQQNKSGVIGGRLKPVVFQNKLSPHAKRVSSPGLRNTGLRNTGLRGTGLRITQEPKVTVTLGGLKSANIQARLGAQTAVNRSTVSTFGKANIVKTKKARQNVTLMSDAPQQKVTMKQRLGTFKAEVSSTTPSFTVTNKVRGGTKIVKTQIQKGRNGRKMQRHNQNVFSRLGSRNQKR